MQKLININQYIIIMQWHTTSCTGEIYNKLPNTKQAQGVYFIKFTNMIMQT